MVLLLWPLAAAHSPHDVVRALAVVDEQVLSAEEVRLARSPDGGDTLHHLDSPAGFPTCLAPIVGAPDAYVLVTDGGEAWRTDDVGASWEPLALDGALGCAPGASGALVAAAAGVVRVTTGEPELLVETPGPLAAVAELADGTLVGVGDDGAFGSWEAEGWVAGAAGAYLTVAAGDGGLLRGSPVGTEWSDDGVTWRFVADVAAWAVAAGDSAWLAASVDDGVWVSVDRGATWAREADGLEEMASGAGAPKPGQPHWFALQVVGDTWWAGAWEGLFRRRAGDAQWTQLQLRGQPMARAVAWMGDELLVADNGGGLARGKPGADDWVDAAPNLGWPWLRTVEPTEGGAGRWYVSGGTALYASDDQGGTVERVATGLDTDGDVFAVVPGWPADGRAWTGGQDAAGGGAVATTADGGATWTVAALPGCGNKPAALDVVAARAWIGCDTRVYLDAGAGPVAVGRAPADVTAVLDDDGAGLVGSAAGLQRFAAGAEPALVWALGRVDSLAREPDGSVLAGTARGLVRFAPDDTPTELGWPTGDVVLALAVDGAGRIAAATYGGVWVSDDGGGVFAPASDWDRYDELDTSFTFAGGWPPAALDGAKTGKVLVGAAGTSVRWHVYAAQVRLVGHGPARVRFGVDGAAGREVDVAREDLGPVLVETLDEGWHDLELEVLDGELTFDGAERWRHHAPLDATPTAPPADGCACATGGGAPGATALAGALGALVWAGRRRGRIA